MFAYQIQEKILKAIFPLKQEAPDNAVISYRVDTAVGRYGQGDIPAVYWDETERVFVVHPDNEELLQQTMPSYHFEKQD